MIKSKYLLSQEQSCKPSGNFVIHETHENVHNKDEQASETTDLHISPQQYVGEFGEESKSWLCCCSCTPINNIQLQMYGQKLSQASSQSSCCFSLCKGELVVSTMSKVLLGRISKSCCCCGSPYFSVENEHGKQVFTISMECCQWGNLCPRWLRLGSEVVYVVRDEREREVGKVTNRYRSCLSSLCGLRDDFEVVLQGVDREKDKILLLNAVVLINQMKHQLF